MPHDSSNPSAHGVVRLLIRAIVVVLTSITLSVAAQAPHPRPLHGVEVIGVPRAEVDLEGLGLRAGAVPSRALLRSAARALLATGSWADVAFTIREAAEGPILVVTLAPNVTLTRIEVHGGGVVRATDLQAAIGHREGESLEDDQLDAIRERIVALLARRGYPSPEVEVTLRDTDAIALKVLVVAIEAGTPRRVSAIAFVDRVGAPIALPHDVTFPDALDAEVGDTLDLERMESSLRAVETAARAEGFLEFAVAPARLEGDRLVLPIHLGHRYRLEVRGEAPLQRADVEGVVDLDAERLTPQRIEALRLEVIALYRRHGFPDAQVQVTRSHDPTRLDADGRIDATRARLLVAISAGERLRVLGIAFPGARHFAQGFLRDQVRSYLEADLPASQPLEPPDSDTVDRVGLSGRPTTARRTRQAPHLAQPATVWYPTTYGQAVEHIRELYQAAGFLDATLDEPTLRRVDDTTGVVEIRVFEGTRARLFDLRVRGNVLLPTRTVLEAIGLQRGEAFSQIALEEARRRVEALYRDRGHLFARVDPSVHRSAEGSRIEIDFDIVERFPVHVGRITIVGAVRTDETLIRQSLTLREGELARPERIRQSEDALLRLGIFSSVSIRPESPDLAERVKDYVVTVGERLPQELALSAGIGTGEGARGALEYSYRNLFGLGVQLTLRVQLAYQFFFQDLELEQAIGSLNLQDRLERRVTLGAAIPFIPGLRDTRATLDLVHLRDNFRDFGLDKNGAVLTVSYQPDRHVQLSISSEVEATTVALFGDVQDLQEYLSRPEVMADPRTQRLLRVPQGSSAITSTRAVVALDLRDSAFTPTQGIYASLAAEWAHTLITERAEDYSHFVKLTLTTSGYIPLARDWVLALQVRGGGVVHLEPTSRTYPNRAYFLGGVDSLRGFLQDQVLPADQVALIDRERAAGRDLSPAAIVRTGDLFALGRAELRFPIVGALQGGLFADVGNVWAYADSADLLSLRVSAGLGLRLATPVGPVALDYGFNLTRRVDLQEPFGAFHFSIGLF